MLKFSKRKKFIVRHQKAASPLRTGYDALHETEVGFSTMATAETRNVSTSFEFSPNFNNKKIMCSHKEW